MKQAESVAEIKAAVDAGRQVYWHHTGYQVEKDRLGEYNINYKPNGSSIGLTHQDGETLNGELQDFVIV